MARPALFRATSLAAILILAAGCTDLAPTAPQLESSSVATSRENANRHPAAIGQKANVVKASYEKGVYSAEIGIEGGTIDFGIGTIHFPVGAVRTTTTITAATDGERMAVEFGPHGLNFTPGRLPTLTFSTAQVDHDPTALQVQYTDKNDVVLEELTTFSDIGSARIRARLSHFSTYVMSGV